MVIRRYNELTTTQKYNFFVFLEKIKQQSLLPASVNMWDDDWENKTNSLPFILEKTDRFKYPYGEFHILYDNNNIIACGGVYKSDFNDNIVFAGTRTWIDSNYRNQSLIREYILPIHKAWGIKNNCKIVALCFNEYNKNLISVFKRIRLGEKSNRIKNRSSNHLFHSGLYEVGFPVTIQFTKQWVIYEKIDKEWDFDWDQIKNT